MGCSRNYNPLRAVRLPWLAPGSSAQVLLVMTTRYVRRSRSSWRHSTVSRWHRTAGDRSLIQSLLENGADQNTWNQYFGNAIYATTYNDYTDIIHLLINRGADIHRTETYGTPLEAAAHQGHVKVMRLLLNREASKDFQLQSIRVPTLRIRRGA